MWVRLSEASMTTPKTKKRGTRRAPRFVMTQSWTKLFRGVPHLEFVADASSGRASGGSHDALAFLV